MKVKAFVDALSRQLKPKEFKAVCRDAKVGRMGFGIHGSQWGDGKGKV